ncbi:response regulator [Caulobacter sp. S45]|uniref:response regulator n=1 Tax=Caulobacter sp. S45 TaxID=1641861 RepID=UPI00157752F1|nr:response regulator [Caulobacter sp. S45]
MSRQIGRHAPYLRRYARALTGSQAKGDSLVQTAMEGLLSGEIVLEEALAVRPALYAALHNAWSRRSDGPRPSNVNGADLHLQELSDQERATLLLTTMEGFSASEAAEVLRCDRGQVDALLQSAETALRHQLAARVLIIEDEPIIALDLTRVARELGHTVVGVAATRTEAVALAHDARPGLVLADVRLADGSSGMDAAADILQDFDLPVIFITAFPEHLLTGDRPEPAFLITKPFREDTVKVLIGQALFFHGAAPVEAVAS